MGFGITPEILRQQWRGETALGGSYEVRGGRPDVVGLSGPAGIRTNHRSGVIGRKQSQKYTFGDGFCGAGGVSRGCHSN